MNTFNVDLGTAKNGETKPFSVDTNGQIKAANASCGCTAVKFKGGILSGMVNCTGSAGSTHTKKVHGKYDNGEGFLIEIQFSIE